MTKGTSVVEAAQDEAVDMDRDHVMQTYSRYPVTLVRGEGCYAFDSNGRRYLDMIAGIAVMALGHSDDRVASAIAAQASRLTHVSNLFYNELQPRLAGRLTALTGMERAFFCNSGAEANETALKIARKHGRATSPEKYEVVAFEGSFHGRTFGALAATAQPKYQQPFEPMVPGFRYAPWNDTDDLDAAVTDRTCAVIVEPIQGESGVQPASAAFLRAIRSACDRAGALMIADEVQTGIGRTGTFLAIEQSAVVPDIVTLGKAVAGGVPMGVCLGRGAAANTLVPGDHGATFGGQPLACAAALATLDAIEQQALMANARRVGRYLAEAVRNTARTTHGRLGDVRGAGLMLAIDVPGGAARDVHSALLAEGVLTNVIGTGTLRLLPPLTLTEAMCDEFATSLTRAVERVSGAPA